MKAALCKSLDGPAALVIEEIDEPVAGEGEVVVRVKAAALNFFDTLITRGKYQVKPPLPFSPSGEVAGIVIATGPGVAGDWIGKRVAAHIGFGGAREKVAVPESVLTPIPDGVPDEAAAGLAIAYGTALHGLEDRGRLRPSESVAVLGAAGGTGLAAVEIAKLLGARVIAVASSADKLELCRKHGADVLIDSTVADLKQTLRDATGGQGCDVVYDAVGGASTEAALRALAWRGRLLVVGFAAGDIPKIPANLLLLKGAEASGVFWGEFVTREPAAHRANMERLFDWVATGRLHVHVHARYPLDQIVEALGVIERRKATGKLIVEIS